MPKKLGINVLFSLPPEGTSQSSQSWPLLPVMKLRKLREAVSDVHFLCRKVAKHYSSLNTVMYS